MVIVTGLLWSGLRSLGRISDRGASDFGERSKRMNMAASRTHDFLGADSTNQQGIGNQRAMTAPTQVNRIAPSTTQPTEPWQVNVAQAGFLQ